MKFWPLIQVWSPEDLPVFRGGMPPERGAAWSRGKSFVVDVRGAEVLFEDGDVRAPKSYLRTDVRSAEVRGQSEICSIVRRGREHEEGHVSNIDALVEALEGELESTQGDEERLAMVLPFVLQVVDAERGFVLMHDDSGDTVVATHNLDPATVFTTSDVSQTIINRTLENGEAIISDNAVQDERFLESNSILLSALRAVMSLPFRSRGRTVGLLYLDNRFQKGAFTRKQLDAVSRLVSSVCASFTEVGGMTRKDGGPGWDARRKF